MLIHAYSSFELYYCSKTCKTETSAYQNSALNGKFYGPAENHMIELQETVDTLIQKPVYNEFYFDLENPP